ncbi:MAG TPA: SDR family NAD(P)-dependent oxidoreductase [Methylocella sp.]|nr:SDR family NAD(P)-dependent oxidoreductase [Methylocella sp.]
MIVLVTGASSGIGRALVLHYLSRGHTVAALARRGERLAALAEEAAFLPGKLSTSIADVTDKAAMEAIVARIEQEFGPIMLAIANAGIAEEQEGPDLDLEQLRRMLEVNLIGAANMLAPVTARMRSRKVGQVVALSSLSAIQNLPLLTAYGASKAAVNALMEGLYWQLRPCGVAVTTICPGFVRSEMTEGRVAQRWCMPLDRAVARIVRAIERRDRLCCFPVWARLGLGCLRLLPGALSVPLLMGSASAMREPPTRPLPF